ncbi:hypothetical protein PUN28_008513 [Cardiocondyla obscurior]|uniref:Uncharacterized protein n=1 Tax=Cardiocondyla obscurior TaxID=286306 RepID=A0AAW2FYN0_9HYME
MQLQPAATPLSSCVPTSAATTTTTTTTTTATTTTTKTPFRERTCPNYYERFTHGPFCRMSRMQAGNLSHSRNVNAR